MTIHMIRVQAEKPSDVTEADANAALDTWVQNHTEWTADLAARELNAVDSSLDGSGVTYFTGDYRFETTSDLTTLIDEAESELGGLVSWYRLYCHECDHDEDGGGGCSWNRNETRTSGTIPSDVPDQ